jgi:glutathione S-transferase
VILPKLYDYVLSDGCYKVRLLLSLLGVPYTTRAVDFFPGREHESEAFRAINPAGTLPVLDDDGEIIGNAEAILVHLARKHDADWLAPTNRWLDFADADMATLSQTRLTSLLGLSGDLDALRRAGRRALRDLEDHLSDRQLMGFDWVEGDRPSIADIALFPHVALSHDAGIGLEDYPALNLWQRRVRKLPNFVGMPGIPDYF